MRYKFLITLMTVSMLFSGLSNAQAITIFSDDFESYSSTITGWNVSSNISLSSNGGVNGSKCSKVAYTQSGTSPYWFSKNVADQNLREIYVKFNFRTDAYASGGSKFLKLFGKVNSPTGYANSTFGINYYSGKLAELSYGDGSGTVNDTQSLIRYGGAHTDSAVGILSSTSEFDFNDGKWHSFQAHMKYNTNGQRDGVYRVWIDGNLRISANNIKNRNDTNSMYFDSVSLGNYTHSNFSTPWNLYYDDVVIATEYIGSQAQMNPPTGLRIVSTQP